MSSTIIVIGIFFKKNNEHLTACWGVVCFMWPVYFRACHPIWMP